MKVIIAAGGSGGHIFPSVALAHELKRKGIKDIYFVSSRRRLDRNMLEGCGFPGYFLSINPMPLRFRPIKMVVFVFKFLMDIITSVYILVRTRPAIIVGFGGYSSGAISFIGKMFRVPVLIHEQNFFPGRANRILSRIADVVAVTFKETGTYFKRSEKCIIHSGNPLRLNILSDDKEKSLKNLGMDAGRTTVLVMGGSQGSSFLNTKASEAALALKRSLGDKIQFLHITGKKDHNKIKDFYADNEIKAAVFSFMERIDQAYAASDLIVSRSGAAAIFEIAYYKKPMILIPYPNIKNNQRSNAIYFSDKGAAIYREEKDLCGDDLYREINDLLKDKNKLSEMSQAAGRLAMPEAGSKLADAVILLGER
ncbi:MAG: undecaprenyldiphospho-muramoylpentapeptide beta-N-acetylglucosaminyltransferase [Candidatus Aadella gelida]|nr:undecaprenyldiphospho-muramoylpentapeptide beta-N-acetylglucosaminyltransferase [Candidatus Aadella gelida]